MSLSAAVALPLRFARPKWSVRVSKRTASPADKCGRIKRCRNSAQRCRSGRAVPAKATRREGREGRERERECVQQECKQKYQSHVANHINTVQDTDTTQQRTHQSRCNSELVSSGDPCRLTYASIALRVGRYSGKKEVHIVRWELHVLIQVRRIGMHSLIFAPRKREHRADLTHVRRCRCRAWSAPAEVPRTYSTQAFTEGVSLRCKGVRAIHTKRRLARTPVTLRENVVDTAAAARTFTDLISRVHHRAHDRHDGWMCP